jgi:hypothetical protein
MATRASTGPAVLRDPLHYLQRHPEEAQNALRRLHRQVYCYTARGVPSARSFS